MDNYNFTKGKWIIEYSNRDDSYDIYNESKDEFVCTTMNSLDIEKYNALLISKAPEMLEALKMFVEAVYTEEIIIKENYDNDGHENCGGRLYQKFKQLIKEATEI